MRRAILQQVTSGWGSSGSEGNELPSHEGEKLQLSWRWERKSKHRLLVMEQGMNIERREEYRLVKLECIPVGREAYCFSNSFWRCKHVEHGVVNLSI